MSMSLYNRFIAFFIIIRIINYKDYIMSDRYGDFVQSSIGKKVAKNLGLPMPTTLDRFESGERLVRGSVLVGRATGDDKSVSESVARILSDVHAEVYVNSSD